MTDPPRPWDWQLGQLASAWWNAATYPMNTGAAALYQATFKALRTFAVGRRITARMGGGELTMTINSFNAEPDVRGMSVGKLGQAELATRSLRWNGIDFNSGGATLHNLRIRPSMPPVLTAGPIDFSIEVPSTAIDPLLRNSLPTLAGLSGAVDPNGVAKIGLSRLPGVRIEVDISLHDSTLWFTPRKLAVRRARIPIPRLVPPVPVRLPNLPRGLVLTSVAIEPQAIRLLVTMPEWEMDVPRTVLEEAAGQLGAVGRAPEWFWLG
ncbi:hypothetical protein ABIA30_001110 [Mycobacterium sp. MAA66]|uniref:hypothetical protein n=1 Tax=Mycobacterium sp. MAA66 TaxID=3156297 RepID=UPI003515BE21